MPSIQLIPLSQIVPSKHQARKSFDETSLKGLAESMKQEGLLNPVVVRLRGEGRKENGATPGQSAAPLTPPPSPLYELISGERRLRAARLLAWTEIEAKVIETSCEAEAAAKGLVENIQREDLNPIEEAEGFKDLNRLDPSYWTQAKIADVCGTTQGHISEAFKMLGMPEEIKDSIRQRILTSTHAVELLRINNANSQKGMANKAVKGQWSVKQLRDAIDALSNKDTSSRTPHSASRAAKSQPDVQWFGKEIIINRHFRPVEESLAEFQAWLSKTLESMLIAMPGLKDSPKSERAMADAAEARAAKANASAQASMDEALAKMTPEQIKDLQKQFEKAQS